MNDENTKKLGSAEIATLLRREISKGNLQLHDRLPAERSLAEVYHVSRGTIREALSRLERDEYIEVRPGSGAYVIHQPAEASVSPISNANPLELIDARFALEPHLCRLAVLHGRRSSFDQLERLVSSMEANASDPVSFAEADTDFHRVLAECTNNNLLIWMIGQITSVRAQDEWTRMRHLTLNEDIIAQYNSQHRQILNAIRLREPERAANLMKEHLETARLSLTRAAET